MKYFFCDKCGRIILDDYCELCDRDNLEICDLGWDYNG